MSLFGFFKNKEREPAPESTQSPEKTVLEQNRDKSVASAREICTAIDALLFSMRSAKKYPQLTEENIADLTERFSNIEKVLSATHCDGDVSELDAKILSLVEKLESQIAESPMEEWDRTVSRLNAAVLARIKSEYEVRLAALDMAELYLEHTNGVWLKQIESLQAIHDEITDEVERLKQEEMIIGTRKNLAMNKQRLEQIRNDRILLENNRVSPSEGTLKDIDELLSKLRTEEPSFVRIAQVNAEAIRRSTIETKVAIQNMHDVNQKLQDAMDAAEMQAKAQAAELGRASREVVEAEKASKREADAVAE